ncbi:MAG: GGDEF domain-containing protein [Clostridia bacterium]|nr:GGDEF domain-containing protein [Clostridia bacterium]
MKILRQNSGILGPKDFLNLINTFILVIHVTLLISFITVDETFLSNVNVISVSLYIFSYLIISRGRYNLYITIMCIEIWVHMISCVVFLGWDVGFQLYCFLLIPMIFLSTYIGISIDKKLCIPIVISIIDVLTFLFGLFYTRNHEPIYLDLLSYGQSEFFYMLNIAIVFFGLITIMFFFAFNAVHAERTLQCLAEYDELTGLYNRRFIRNVLDDVYFEYISSGALFSVAITDIDDFKNVNDTFGHDAGDYVLRMLGERYRAEVPYDSIVGRWGGEEFIVVFKNNCRFEECCNTMDKIRQSIENKPFSYEGHNISITLTAGVAIYEEGMSIADIVRKADARLYKGKAEGKNVTICS